MPAGSVRAAELGSDRTRAGRGLDETHRRHGDEGGDGQSQCERTNEAGGSTAADSEPAARHGELLQLDECASRQRDCGPSGSEFDAAVPSEKAIGGSDGVDGGDGDMTLIATTTTAYRL